MVTEELSTIDDQQLFRDARRGSVDAFEMVVRDFDGPVLQLALRITGSEQDARWMYRETFVKLRANLTAVESEHSLRLWIYRIITSLCIEHLHNQGAFANTADAVTRLAPRERIVFELKHYHGLTLKTVAEILNITEETTRHVLCRAIGRLLEQDPTYRR